jgi:hypothetical protein
MDLTLKRVVQITQAIAERRDDTELVKRLYIEWQTKVLAAFIAHTAMDGESAKALSREAAKLRMLDDEEETAESLEPQVGSYEALVGGLGGVR